jgi:hypothetical protein
MQQQYVHFSHKVQEIFIVGGPLRAEVYRIVSPNTMNRNFQELL